MNGHELLEKLGLVDETYVTEADKKPAAFRRWGGIAAVVCLVVALGIILPQLGGRTGPGSGDSSGYTGHEATEFMRYEGPVLPLTVWDETDLTAERDLTLDFSPYSDGAVTPYHCMRIKDSYVLTNPTDGEVVAMVSYPVIGSFREAEAVDITVGGQTVETLLQAGMYSGDFRGAGYETTSMNLSDITSWEGYRDLLQDGSYMAEVRTQTPTLDAPVTVYEITDISHNAPEDATNPTLNFTFTLPKDSIVLSYGFNGGRHGPDGGPNERHFSIPKDFNTDYGKPKYLIFLGEDIDGYTMQGYSDGSCEAGKEIAAEATVTRYETTLGEILDECAGLFYDGLDEEYLSPDVTEALYLDQVRRYFTLYGVTGTEAKERYQFGSLEDIIGETVYHKRVLYYTFPVTVGAGDSVTVEAATVKRPSYDFDCTGSPNAGIDGYDMVTQLGSPLTFTGQSAAIENYDHIDIVRQNFGFDVAGGVTKVDLDMAQEHYYIEVRERKEK